jgi:hypothetical protein
MGPLETEIEEIMRFHISSIPAVQNAFKAGRTTPIKEDLVSTTSEGAILECLEIVEASINALREAIRRIARELEDRTPA